MAAANITLAKDNFCFVCGQKNPKSLKLHIVRDGEKGAKTEFIADKCYRGWADYLHGGVISLIFDELLGWISIYVERDAVTARLEVRYRKPVPLGSRLVFKAVLEKETKGLLEISTCAYLDDGTIVADGKGKMMVTAQKP